MVKTHFKTTLRYLWRNRLFTALHILGLAVGISACWMIFVIVNYEGRFNKRIPDGDRVFQVVSSVASVPRPMVKFVADEIAGVELTVPVHLQTKYDGHGDMPGASIINDPEKQIATNSQYFDLVHYEWLTGNKATALDAPDKVVLTQSRANQYFPGMDMQDVHGHTLLYNDSIPYIISGIVADLPYQSSFEWQEFFRIAFKKDHRRADSWNVSNVNELLYVKLKPHVVAEEVGHQIDAINALHNKENFEKYQYTQTYRLLPLSEFHYASAIGGMRHRTVDKAVLYGLTGIAVFLILLAVINYINLSTAQLQQRASEIGIRKTLGSNPRQLIGRFLMETLAITFVAALFSILLSEVFSRLLADFMPPDINLYDHLGLKLLFLVALIAVVTLVAGIYPAWLVIRVRTVNMLKPQALNSVGGGRINLRKALVVFQFAVAMVFISCSLIMGEQLRFALTKDLGFAYDAVLSVNIPERIHQQPANQEKQLRLKRALEQYPVIVSASIGHPPMDDILGHTTFFRQRDTGLMEVASGAKYIDEDYLKTFSMEVLAGRNIDVTKGTPGLILNNAAVSAFGFKSPDDAVGKMLLSGSNPEPVPIAGVVADFHQQDFRNPMSPVVLMFGYHMQRDIHIKLASANPEDWHDAIAKIETEWKEIYPEAPFTFRFYDEVVSALYIKDRQTSKLINAATGITIFISCLGLFGLATLMAFQRTKEIGIRKVLGASVSGIVAMLSKDFVKLVIVAIVIASPIAWWVMDKWLEDFAYRIDIQWWMFALAGLAAVVMALLTVSWQAIRAAVANPVGSLRDE
ncbi:FtsX-like permease family protein [Parapedobacter sp. 10938]|uniref:FtsX-like permease family protein n=1 Tax=Parapedobacter flavus TaxID=3110225 RepID=UPI002DBF1517|nr:FtsX-like permease family protein [Parapedobacter sp. 10938]MEC3879701.1 FtsX-like permease family protein [Parapedobacter sp. 10938]